MRLVKVESKVYIWDETYTTRTITYTLKYLRSSKRITFKSTFKSVQDCFDLDEVLLVTNVALATELDNYLCISESVYIPKFKLCVLKPFYEGNEK